MERWFDVENLLGKNNLGEGGEDIIGIDEKEKLFEYDGF